MFHLHQSNELCFQISPDPHKKQSISSEDMALSLSHDNNQIENRSPTRKSPLRSLSANNNLESSNDDKNENKSNKKMKHRDIERQRRQEMASLHGSLRSLLPHHLIKGKRSVSDHINESAGYIKHLQGKIRELGSMRDELKLKQSGSDSDNSPAPTESAFPPVKGSLTVQSCCTGVEITISTCSITGGSEEGIAGNLPLSRVLEVLLKEGLNVVSFVSTKVNGLSLHTIQSEANEKDQVNMSELEQTLKEVFFQSNNLVV